VIVITIITPNSVPTSVISCFLPTNYSSHRCDDSIAGIITVEQLVWNNVGPAAMKIDRYSSGLVRIVKTCSAVSCAAFSVEATMSSSYCCAPTSGAIVNAIDHQG